MLEDVVAFGKDLVLGAPGSSVQLNSRTSPGGSFHCKAIATRFWLPLSSIGMLSPDRRAEGEQIRM